jgi:hypothetical protein
MSEEREIRDRALRLFTFLKEVTELRSKTVRVLDQYERVLWLQEIPRENGCQCVAWRARGETEEEEAWVQVRKPQLQRPPTVPTTLEPWLDPREVENSSLESPKLRERIVVNVPDPAGSQQTQATFRDLAAAPEIVPLWNSYVEGQWNPWAEKDRRNQAVQRVYADLFSIYQKQQRLGEAYEVVLGLGCLAWKTPNGQEVKRHLITAQTSLTFDAVP